VSGARARIAGVRLRAGMASWAVPAAGAGIIWSEMGDPGHRGGLGAAEGLALAAWPFLLAFVLYGLPAAVVGLAVPWRLRRWYRRGYDRPAVAAWLRRAVYAADRYRCCWCRGRFQLQVDHIRPWSLGGLTCLWNTAVLCGRCNRVKSNYWRFRSGHVVYRAFEGSADARVAAAILAHEKRMRWNAARWLRAVWALGVI
jgi:hypothetical protein